MARAAANGYTSLAEVVSDMKVAASTLKDDLNLPTVLKNNFQAISPSDTELSARIDLLVKKAEDLTQREAARSAIKQRGPVKAEISSANMLTGIPAAARSVDVTRRGDGKLVLSLFGGAPAAREGKQMFSSLQRGITDKNGTISVARPLRDTALPNGITATGIVSNAAIAEDKPAAKTLGQLFTTGNPLPFTPAKSSRASGKQSAQGWDIPRISETTRSRNNQSYYQQDINIGKWLNYSGTQPKFSDRRRKHRERALSLSGVRPSMTDAEADQQEAAELDALFCSAYSSFAPTKDDTEAIVTTKTMAQIWWQRQGEQAFERLTKNFENAAIVEEVLTEDAPPAKDEAAEFEDAINHWDEVIDPSLLGGEVVEKSAEEKDAEEILESISELLETLNSYQRNRNLAPPAVSRSGAPSLVGAPNVAQPNEEEARTYSILKSQLSLMISTLPPYVVAKLNSDQLSELNISTKIPVYVEPYKGVLEEDESAARAKLAQMSAATPSRAVATPTQHRPNPSAQFGNQYNTAPRAPSGGAQYYQNSTPQRPSGPIRPPQTAGPVPYNAAAPRPLSGQGYRPATQYGSPAVPVQTPQPQLSRQTQYAQNAAAYYLNQTPRAQQSHGTNGAVPQTAPQPLRYQPPATQTQSFQPRPLQANGVYSGYPAGSNPQQARHQSPVKPSQPLGNGGMGQQIPGMPTAGYQAHMAAQQQARAQAQQQYGTPTHGTTTPAAQTYYGGGSMGMSAGVPMAPTLQQQISNGVIGSGTPTTGPSPVHSPAMTTAGGAQNMSATSGGPLGPTGYRTTMTPQEEASLMARQRLAATQAPYQAQARMAAQNGAQSSMTPSAMSQSPITPGAMTPGPMTPGNNNTRMGGV